MGEILENRTLRKNSISKFILRVDFGPTNDIDFIEIINSVSHLFDRTEKRTQTNFIFNLNTSNSEIDSKEETDYVLINERENFNVTFSNFPKAFWFETSRYVDNSTYKLVIDEIIKSFKGKNPEIVSKRIGMRFINEFKTAKKQNISKIFSSNVSKHITSMATHDNVSRIIVQEEYNFSTYKMRIQYGIPNKFYPSVLNNFDLLLDIDSYDDSQQKIICWESIIKELNHASYTKFIEFVNANYIEELK